MVRCRREVWSRIAVVVPDSEWPLKVDSPFGVSKSVSKMLAVLSAMRDTVHLKQRADAPTVNGKSHTSERLSRRALSAKKEGRQMNRDSL